MNAESNLKRSLANLAKSNLAQLIALARRDDDCLTGCWRVLIAAGRGGVHDFRCLALLITARSASSKMSG
jgi:hypothetical protein